MTAEEASLMRHREAIESNNRRADFEIFELLTLEQFKLTQNGITVPPSLAEKTIQAKRRLEKYIKDGESVSVIVECYTDEEGKPTLGPGMRAKTVIIPKGAVAREYLSHLVYGDEEEDDDDE